MKICLVATFPPSGRQLNEYAFYIARELQRNPHISLTILADELTDYEFATDETGKSLNAQQQAELPGFDVIRCWKFNSLATPVRLLNTIRKLNPDVVWFNLVFSSFATPEYPVAAFAGLSVPALTRTLGYYTHITLHHILEHVDFAGAGVRQGRVLRLGSNVATRALLKANSVSVLLSGYRRTLIEKGSAQNVLLGTHGTFAPCPSAPDFTKRGNPEHRILAIGHCGTYKRLETLLEAFPSVLKKVPNAKLIVAGANHHTRPGYWESIRESQAWVRGLSSGVMCRKKPFLTFSGQPRSWSCPTIPQPGLVAPPIRLASMGFQSCALTFLIFVAWRRTKIWRSVSIKSGMRQISPTNWSQYCSLRSSNVKWRSTTFRRRYR